MKLPRGFTYVTVNFSLFGRDARCEHPHLTPSYLDNLSRLGLIEIPASHYAASEAYEELENHPSVVEIRRQIDAEEGHSSEIEKRIAQITQLGGQFINACVIDHRELQPPESQPEKLPTPPSPADEEKG
jgi:hypothetical protein